MSKLIIEIETISAGQPRPYADSIYKYRVSSDFYWDSTTGPRLSDSYLMKEKEALNAVSSVRGCPVWFAKDDRMWYEAYLESVVEATPGVWEVTIIQPYLD